MDRHLISTIILETHWIILIGLSVRIIMRRPPVGVSVAWLMVIFGLPFVGAILYLLVGEKRLGRYRAANIAARVEEMKTWQQMLEKQFPPSPNTEDNQSKPIKNYITQVLGFPPLPLEEIELLDNTPVVFERMIQDIDQAQKHVQFCFYIWDEIGQMMEVVDAIMRAAQRGVICRIMADSTGSFYFFRSLAVAKMREAGVEFIESLPTGLLRTIFVRVDLRNHRKIAVIDDHIAYTGSQNMVDPQFFMQNAGVGQWVDAMVRFTGPAATALSSVFRLDWAVETEQPFEPPVDTVPGKTVDPDTAIQVVPSGPDLHPKAIHQLLLSAIYAARKEIVITTPYFIPDEAVLTALITAASSGVKVTLIVPKRNDSRMVRYAGASHYDDLLSAGAQIARYKGGLLHTKSLTVDGQMSIFGSVNLDMRSLWLNFEISLFVYNPTFTARLRQLQNSYLQDTEWLDLTLWRQRSALRQFTENLFRLFGPLL